MVGKVGETRSHYRVDKKWEEERNKAIIESGVFTYPVIEVDLKTQRRGIDIYIMTPSGKVSVEMKTVRYPSDIGGITLETHSNLERSGNPDGIGDGWISYSEADWLAWCFLDKMYLWNMQELRSWFCSQDVTRWPAYDKDNIYYTTRSRHVLFEDIPLWHDERDIP